MNGHTLAASAILGPHAITLAHSARDSARQAAYEYRKRESLALAARRRWPTLLRPDLYVYAFILWALYTLKDTRCRKNASPSTSSAPTSSPNSTTTSTDTRKSSAT